MGCSMMLVIFQTSYPIWLIDQNGKLMIDLGFQKWFLTLIKCIDNHSISPHVLSQEVFDATAYATSEELDLESLLNDLDRQGLYINISLPQGEFVASRGDKNKINLIIHENCCEQTEKYILKARCKAAVTPLLTYWSYCSLALNQRFANFVNTDGTAKWKFEILSHGRRGHVYPTK